MNELIYKDSQSDGLLSPREVCNVMCSFDYRMNCEICQRGEYCPDINLNVLRAQRDLTRGIEEERQFKKFCERLEKLLRGKAIQYVD